jgi:hypothetical protein
MRIFSGTSNATGSSIEFHTGVSGSVTERMRLDASGNLGLGVTPAAWFSTYKAIQVNTFGGLYGFATNSGLATNAYDDGAWKFSGTGFANRYLHLTGTGNHQWLSSTASGSAGGAITWSTLMNLDASGNLGLGVTPSAWGSIFKVMQVGAGASYVGGRTDSVAGRQVWLGSNSYYNGTNWIYGVSQPAAQYYQNDGSHIWNTAPSGTAGNTITFTQAMTLDASGNLLVGKTSVDDSLAGIALYGTTTGPYISATRNGLSGAFRRLATDGDVIGFRRDATSVGSISVTTTATAYNTSSDYRLKNITGPITNSGAYIDSLKPVEGTWKNNNSVFVGLIAHEVQEVSRTKVATGVKDGEEMQTMDYSSAELIANLIAEIQSLRARVAQLEAQP